MLQRIKNLLELFDIVNNKWLTEEAVAECRRLYPLCFGKTLSTTCNTCVLDAYIEFKILIKNPDKIKQMENSKFKLKKNVVLDTHSASQGPCGHYTNANITDEVALGILKVQPKQIKHFEVFPENWEALVEKFVSGKKKAAPASTEGGLEEKTMKDLIAIAVEKGYSEEEYKKATGKKADMIEYLNSKNVPASPEATTPASTEGGDAPVE